MNFRLINFVELKKKYYLCNELYDCRNVRAASLFDDDGHIKQNP